MTALDAAMAVAPPGCAIMRLDLSAANSEQPRGDADARLAARLASRDPGALDEAYERYGRICFGFLVNTLRDRPTAEDVQQQVFLELWQRAPTYDSGRGSLLTWIMTIARSRAIDQLRRRIPEPVGSPVAVERNQSAVDETEALVEQWRFAGLLERLHSDEAMVLRMRFYEELTQAEIAQRTGIPLGTVKTRMVTGLKRLRDLLEQE
ncbi:MAG TPA: sigma-70 family RNA polymerase sigma factor [Solirubrobacterales bacterium]|jgi:RNA polymerase sigma-70 factor, ECF subfamily|nr:sigma-70 family RNA polymerase sigma factor [Solirubrobacterales bacterium]